MTIDRGMITDGEAGMASEAEFPHYIKLGAGKSATVAFDLPYSLDQGNMLFVYTSKLNVSVMIGNDCIGKYMAAGNYSSGTKIPVEWYSIKINSRYAGQKIRIIYTAGKDGYSGWIEKMYEGDRMAIIYHIIKTNIFPVIEACFILIAGIIVLLSYFAVLRGKSMQKYVYLGVSMAMSGMQIIMHSPMRQVYLENISYAHKTEYIYAIFSAVPFLMFICCIIKDDIHRNEVRAGFISAAVGIAADSAARYIFSDNRFYWCYSTGLFLMYFCFICRYFEQLVYVGREQREAVLLNDEKTQFLADMSHAIRTPVNSIMGMDTMILRESRDSRIIEYASDIKNAVASLLSIIDDILDFSKIESGKLAIVPAPYDLSSLIYDSYNMMVMRARNKGLQLTADNDPEIPDRLMGDEVRIRQIVINLMTNAIKYTHEGSVELKISQEKLQHDRINLLIDVKDTGIGIRPENITSLFSSYVRLDEIKNRGIEGTGLGLSITKELVNLMGGSISVNSEYGKGSVFHVSIPQTVLRSEAIGDYSERIRKQREEMAEKQQWFYAPSAHILIVDDVEMNIKVMKALLSESDMQIDAALSGKECLELVKCRKYDMIFMDHMMPEMDGIETFRRIRELDNLNSEGVPVIMLTANAVMGAREKYLAEGFSDYISKPVDEKTLVSVCRKYLRSDLIEEDFPDRAGSESRVKDIYGSMKESLGNYLNVNEGLSFCMNKQDFYIDMLRDFAASDRMDLIRESFSRKDISGYRINVHALKSSAHMLGADDISAQAKSLEAAAAENDTEYIDNNHDRLISDYEKLVSALKEILESDRAGMTDIEKDARESDGAVRADGDYWEKVSDGFIKLLENIYKASDDFDMDSVEEKMHVLQNYRLPEALNEDMDGLKRAVNDIDYDEIKSYADRLMSEAENTSADRRHE